MRSHARTAIRQLACETGEDGNGQVEMSALELAALRSALHAEKHEIVVTSQNAGGGMEPLVEKGEKAESKTDFVAQRAEKEKRIRSAYAESLERVRYPRKCREADPAHTIARKVGHSVKPGELPWAHPSGKPAPWSTIQIDQDFINNGPAPHELPETALLTQSRPYFVSVDPMCATIRSVHPRPQNYELSRLFDGWYHEPHNLLPSRTNSSKADSRPQTGYSSKSAKTPRTPLTPEQNIFVQSAGCGPSRLNSRLYKNIPIGNPAAFKLKDIENIWAVDSELLVSDRQTSFGAHTYRDYRPNSLRLHSPGTDRSLASQDSNPVTKVRGSRRPDPLSPVIREIVLAIPRAKARGRDDIPLIASPLGSRGPVSHGSFVPAAARTVNSMDNLYCATQNNSRGTKYIGDTLQNSSIRFVSSSSPQNKDGTWNEFKESDAGPTGEGNVIPFVNLNTYDESFSSPQRLTPMSRKALQRAGFETGAIYCFPCTHQSVNTLIPFFLQKCLYVLRGEDWWRFVRNVALAPANAALAPEV
jgi:hypothetical protein